MPKLVNGFRREDFHDRKQLARVAFGAADEQKLADRAQAREPKSI